MGQKYSRRFIEVLGNNINAMLLGLVIIVFVTLLFRSSMIVEVHGASMEPTIKEGDIIFVNKFWIKKSFKKGDIVIFHRGSDSKNIIKRIVGCPFDTVVYENNFCQDTLILGKDDYYVVGDNKDKSIDSRNYGPIIRQQIIGRKMLRIK